MAEPAGTRLRHYQRLIVVDTGSETLEREGCFPDEERFSADHRRLLQWLESYRGGQESHRLLELRNVPGALQLDYRRLMAVMMAIQSFALQLRGRTVQLHSDNITTLSSTVMVRSLSASSLPRMILLAQGLRRGSLAVHTTIQIQCTV